MDKQQVYESLSRAYFSDNPDEKDILDWFAPILSRSKCFVDFGASLGQYTRLAARNMRNGTIYAIEADPIRFEELERNCAKWQAETGNTITAIHAAVSDKDGTITFNTTDSNVSGGIAARSINKPDVQWREVTVPAFTIDAFFAGKPVDLVKMDIEGAEVQALLGGVQTLKTRSIPMFIEVHSWGNPDAVRMLMKGAGYAETLKRGKYYFTPA